MRTTGAPAARAARWRAWRSASVMGLSPIDLRGMGSTPKRDVTKPRANGTPRHHPSDGGLDGPGAALTLLALFQPVAIAVHLQDVDMVGEPVEQCAGEPFGGEHAGPFIERQVAGDDGRTALIAFWLNTSNSNSAPVCDSGT